MSISTSNNKSDITAVQNTLVNKRKMILFLGVQLSSKKKLPFALSYLYGIGRNNALDILNHLK
jgi:hypothetical protein